MGQPETQAVLVPPPPAPPAGRVGAASPDPSREPARSSVGFLSNVLGEIKRFVWPVNSGVWSKTMVAIGLLTMLTLFVSGLNGLAHWLVSVLIRG